MTNSEKPGAPSSGNKPPERDYSKEIRQMGFIPGAPTSSTENKVSTPPPSAPEVEPDVPMSELLLRLLTRTKPGIFFMCLFALFIVSQIVHLGSFGPLTLITLFLAVYTAYQYRLEVVIPLREGGKADTHLIAILLIPTLILGFIEVTFLWKQHAATELTREISGNPDAWAQCQRFTPALLADSLNAGYYAPSQDKDKSIIQYIYCKEWGNFYFSWNRDGIDDMHTLWSVGTVIHEAIHVSGELNEATTQCLTIRAFPNVLRRFGLSESKIQEDTARFAQGSLRMPSMYLNGQCEKHPIIDRLPQLFGAKSAR